MPKEEKTRRLVHLRLRLQGHTQKPYLLRASEHFFLRHRDMRLGHPLVHVICVLRGLSTTLGHRAALARYFGRSSRQHDVRFTLHGFRLRHALLDDDETPLPPYLGPEADSLDSRRNEIIVSRRMSLGNICAPIVSTAGPIGVSFLAEGNAPGPGCAAAWDHRLGYLSATFMVSTSLSSSPMTRSLCTCCRQPPLPCA